MSRIPLVALLLTVLLAGCDQTTATEHQTRARALIEQDDYRTAVIELKNALQKEPELASARYLLGVAQQEIGDYPSALKEFERALDLGHDAPDLEARMLALKVDLGRYQEVIGELALEGERLSPELAVILGEAYLAGGDADAARSQFARGAELSDGQMGLGTLAWYDGDTDAALEHLQRALELDEDNIEAWLRLGELQLSLRDAEAASRAFARARDLPRGELTGALGLARVALLSEDLTQALSGVEAVLADNPDVPMAHYLLALVEFEGGDWAAAESALREVQSRLPDHAPSLYLMGAVKFQQQQFAQAENNLDRFLRIDPGNESARKLLASLHFQQGDLQTAAATLEPLRSSSADPQVFAMLGTIELRLGNSDAATAALEQAVALAPDEAPFRNQLALSLLSAGDRDRAESELSSAIDVDGEQFQSDYLLAMLHVRDREYDQAAESVEAIIAKDPDNPFGHNLMGAVAMGRGDAGAAEQAFRRALTLDAGYVPAVQNLARLFEQQDGIAAAEGPWRSLLKSEPGNAAALLALAQLKLRQNDTPAARQLLEQAAKDAQSLRAQLALARLQLASGEVEAAAESTAAAARLAPQSPDVLLLQAEVALASGDAEAARTATGELEQIAESLQEPNARFLQALGLLHLRLGDAASAQERFEAAFAASGETSVPALRGLLQLDLGARRLEAVTARLERLQALGDAGPEFELLSADLAQLRGDDGAAVAAYERLAEQGVRQAVTRLASLQLRLGEIDAARSALTDWLSTNRDDRGVRLLLADAHMRAGDDAAAVAVYEDLEDVGSPVVFNNLAWLYLERGDERALTMARRAYELAPQSADIADTLGWALVKAGNAEEAVTYLSQSARQLPDNPTVQYHLGVALADAGSRDEAVAALRQALAAEAFPEREQALAKLRELENG